MISDTCLILHDIRSAENVGSIFRTADAAGVNMIYLTGYTPAPVDVFKRPNSKIAKTALGAEKTIVWEKVDDVFAVISKLKKQKTEIIALEQDEQAIDYKEIKLKSKINKISIIFGNEVAGISKDVLNECDQIIFIPMKGAKESLNVAVAGGIALFRLLGI